MSDAIVPNIGEIWEDTDPRVPGRRVQIVGLTLTHAHVRVISNPTTPRSVGREVKVSIARMRASQGGHRGRGYRRITSRFIERNGRILDRGDVILLVHTLTPEQRGAVLAALERVGGPRVLPGGSGTGNGGPGGEPAMGAGERLTG